MAENQFLERTQDWLQSLLKETTAEVILGGSCDVMRIRKVQSLYQVWIQSILEFYLFGDVIL